MVLIGLLCEYFFYNLTNVKIPKHVISVSKSDILNIKVIKSVHLMTGVKLNCSLIDLSKLESLSKRLLNSSFLINLDV